MKIRDAGGRKMRFTLDDSATVSEIRKEVADAIARGEGRVVKKSTIVHEVVYARKLPAFRDADFYRACAFIAVKILVGEAFRQPEVESETAFLPGFPNIRKNYLVKRGKESCKVPFTLMTREEIRAKALELRAHAAGTISHADELDRYADSMSEERPTAQA